MVDKIRQYIKLWENRCYHSGIPDELPYEIESNLLAPSYRKICIAIMKNDVALKSLGFEPRRSKYYDELKRIELAQRGKAIQLKLNL